MDHDVLRMLSEGFRRRSIRKLKKANDELLNAFLRERRKEIFDLAVVSYVLFKILTKPRFFTEKGREHMRKLAELLEKLTPNNISEVLPEIEKEVMEMEEKDPRYVFDLFTKARVKMAATLYAKGLSLGLASKFSGIPKQEILSYAGKTMMFERVKEEVPVWKRYKAFRRFAEG